MKHAEFKAIARQHQIDFKVNDPEINIAADRFPIRTIRKNGKKYKIVNNNMKVYQKII